MTGRALKRLLVPLILKNDKWCLAKEHSFRSTSDGTFAGVVHFHAGIAHASQLLRDVTVCQPCHDLEELHNSPVRRQILRSNHHQHPAKAGVRHPHHCQLAFRGSIHHNCLHEVVVQHHCIDRSIARPHHQREHSGISYLHRCLLQRCTMHYHRDAHASIICNYRSLSASASQANNDGTVIASGIVNRKGLQHREALAVELQALCNAEQIDHATSTALEAFVEQLTLADDPEGLLLGAACLKLATVYAFEKSPNILKGLSYAHRAIKAYEPRGPSLKLATCLYMAALVHFTMGDFKKALVQLEQSALVVKRVKVTPCDKYCVALKHEVQSIMGEACDQFCNGVNFEVQTLFGIIKVLLGMHAEAAAHYHRSIKIKQKLLKAGSKELATFYFEVAEALKEAKDHKTAKELCVKSLKILLKQYGRGSFQEAKVRSLLSKVHCDLGNYEDSLSESELAKTIWKQFGEVEEVHTVNLSSYRLLADLKRWNIALLRLEEIMEASSPGSKSHTIALILAARAHTLLNNQGSAADYCSRAFAALEHHDACTQIAGNLVLLSVAYEEKKEYEQAALICRKAKEMFEQCSGLHVAETAADLEGKMGCLMVHAGKTTEAIPHLESCLSKLQNIPGADLLYVHFYLGLAYPEVERYEKALEHFEAAKSSLSGSLKADASLAASIYCNLAATYSALDRLEEAIECQKVAVKLVKENVVEDFTLEEVESRLISYIREIDARAQCDRKI